MHLEDEGLHPGLDPGPPLLQRGQLCEGVFRGFLVERRATDKMSKRELERHIRSGAVLRSTALPKKVSPAVAQIHPTAIDEFKNAYNLEFLSLPDSTVVYSGHGLETTIGVERVTNPFLTGSARLA